jgi:hypothetical protein
MIKKFLSVSFLSVINAWFNSSSYHPPPGATPGEMYTDTSRGWGILLSVWSKGWPVGNINVIHTRGAFGLGPV